MAQFKDNRGTTWELTVTIESLKRVRDALGIDLGNIHLGDPPQSTRLDTDVILLIDVIYVLLRPQAEAKGISDSEFGESLGGDAAFAAREAFWGSLIDFFQKFHRTDAVAAIRKQMELLDRVLNEATNRINQISIEKESQRILQSSGAPFTDGPDSSESSQDD